MRVHDIVWKMYSYVFWNNLKYKWKSVKLEVLVKGNVDVSKRSEIGKGLSFSATICTTKLLSHEEKNNPWLKFGTVFFIINSKSSRFTEWQIVWLQVRHTYHNMKTLVNRFGIVYISTELIYYFFFVNCGVPSIHNTKCVMSLSCWEKNFTL